MNNDHNNGGTVEQEEYGKEDLQGDDDNDNDNDDFDWDNFNAFNNYRFDRDRDGNIEENL